MDTNRIIGAQFITGVIGFVTPAVTQYLPLRKIRIESEKLFEEAMKAVNESIKLEPPPSIKAVWLNNLSDIPTALAIVLAAAFLYYGIKTMCTEDNPKKRFLEHIVAIAGAAFTFYCTNSLPLSVINLASIYVFKEAAPLDSALIALVSKTLYSFYEYKLNYRNYNFELNKHVNEYYDYNGGAARKAMEVWVKASIDNYISVGKKFGVSIVATGLGTAFGEFAAKKILSEKEQQNYAACLIGAVTTGALSFYFTRSIGFSLMNASVSALAPILLSE